MSSQNPFFEDDLIASISRDVESVKSKQQAGLQAFLKTQTPKIINKPTFNLSQFMSFNFTHLTKFSMAGLAVFTLLAGGLSAQAFAPDEYKPLTFLQQEFLKNFGSVKNETNTLVLDTTNTQRNKISVEFCSNLKISYFNDTYTSASTGQFDYDVVFKDDGTKPFDGRLNPNQVYFHIKCTNDEITKVYGSADYNLYDKMDLETSLCTANHVEKPAGQTGVGSICVVSYNENKINKNELPFLTNSVKLNLNDDAVIVNRKFKERQAIAEDNIYVFSDKNGNNYELNIQNKNAITSQSNLQIDLKQSF